jgi:arabinofuranosyltransferase
VGGAPGFVYPHARSETGLERAIYVVAAVLIVAGLYRARRYYVDDAYITLRYAERWLAGKGLTWTDGERVEGYTHPLWLLQIALLGRLGVALPDSPRVLGVAYLAAIFAVFQRARALPFSVLVLATLPGLSLWAMGGLETVSFAFWLILAALLTVRIVETEKAATRSGALAGSALAAAALTRPEGLAVAVVVAAWVARSRQGLALRGLLIAFAVPVSAWEVLRLAYYGDLVANPARVKLGGYPLLQDVEGGFSYLWACASSWAYAVLPALLVLSLATTRRAAAPWILAMALPVVAGLLLGGGDHMAGARLFLPAAVLVVFAAGISGQTRPRWLGPALMTCGAALQAPVALANDRGPDLAVAYGQPTGRFFEQNLPVGSLIAMATVGSTPFLAPSMRFIDTLGLNDRHIARRTVPLGVATWQAMAGHLKGDGAYVLSRAPDVVVLGGPAGNLGEDPRQWFLTDSELLELPGFREHYRPYGFRLPEDYLIAYLRKGSAAADTLAMMGRLLRSPWEVLPNQHSRSNAAVAHGVAFPRE